MIWAYPDFKLLIILAGAFALGYLFYISRFWLINRRLKVEKRRLLTKLILRTSYFILFLIAFAGPSIGTSTKEVKEEGKDIFLAIDLSQSMNATDIGPSRLQRIKFELKELIKNFPSDRIGLIIFSSEAYMQCPLTFDQNVIQLYLDGLNTGLVPNAGTDLSGPLRMALDRFVSDVSPEVKSKSVVLISDGEDFGGEYEDVAASLAEAGIKVFSLGIGTDAGSSIPRGNGVVIDPNTGRPAETRLDRDALQKIAIETGGRYFEISDVSQEVSDLIGNLERLEGGTIGTRQVEASSNKYFYFLLAGLILSVLDMILPIKTIKL
ncbi:VWA domain-containing protein [Algoriphagus sp. NF]|jgi:Mg-chelatase subunit ChlD|uniref:VWA domain-containing protein n=2 Tax=Algoriphagus TaxID=246875 RepID=A0ABS7N224_9BACT|nr:MULTISPECIES: VWA domain-containing protein [Algoriphagus]MBY5950384.1 VWA domain-containing protein [Algoriphagus marincola]MDE0560605.1 VWA domain-containing protein [Algoriphagus sp. NF]TDK42627.1 VWA domain-containing protein [Algoriphagus aquimaris]